MATIGFTGGRTLPPMERATVGDVVSALPRSSRVITGACIGVDAYVAQVASATGKHVHTILPANRALVDAQWQERCDTFQVMPEGTTYKDRNQEIVDQSDRLIAFPSHAEGAPESRRSGTWQTIRMARRAGKPVDVYVLCAGCRQREVDRRAAHAAEVK